MFPHRIKICTSAFLLTLIFVIFSLQGALAQTARVTLSGVISNKAILNIDGHHRTLSIGQEYQGIKLVSAQGQSATIWIVGVDSPPQKLILRVGEAPFTTKPSSQDPQPATISNNNHGRNNNEPQRCIPAEQHVYVSRNGMFKTLGYINGKAVDFIIDTGASLVSMDEKQANALGITDYKKGRSITLLTANGSVQAYLITLESVKVGLVEVKNVQASVGGDSNIILLGNTFLSKVDVEMTPNRIVLRKTCH